MQAFLYKAFNASGDLLYVGITNNISRRLRDHEKGSEWFGECCHFRLERHVSMADAAKAEIEAVRSENPKHNKIRFSQKREEDRYLEKINQKYADFHPLVKRGIEHAGSPGAFLEKLGVTRQAVHQWKGGLPELRRFQIEEMLASDPPSKRKLLRKNSGEGE